MTKERLKETKELRYQINFNENNILEAFYFYRNTYYTLLKHLLHGT